MSWLLLLAIASTPLREIQALELVGDRPAAIERAYAALECEPESKELHQALICALAAGGKEVEAAAAYQRYVEAFPDDAAPELAERVAWGVIERSARSTPLISQLAGTVGAVMAGGMPAVNVALATLSSPNSLIRAAGAEMCGQMGDAALCDRLLELLKEERVTAVRVAVIRTLGQLHVGEAREELKRVVAAPLTPLEERVAAIGAVVEMTEEVEEVELERLLTHTRAGMRQLGCQLIAELDLDDKAFLLEPLLGDTRADVRAAALKTFGLLRTPGVVGKIGPLLDDPDPLVSITAAWLLTLHQPEEGMHRLSRWLLCEHVEWQRRAAAAVAATGKYGAPLAAQWLEAHPDNFVRANLALGLIGQQQSVERARDLLFDLFEKEKGRWMWEGEGGELFSPLVPSRVRYKGVIPNYPEAVNQSTRIELVSVLAAAGHPRAGQVVRDLLLSAQWGITGMASVTLLQEGDELAIDLVRGLLHDEDPKVRVQAALALAIWGRDPTAVDVLVDAYPTSDRETKLVILEGIGRVGSARSLPFLVEEMNAPFELPRLFAASAVIQTIRQCGGEDE